MALSKEDCLSVMERYKDNPHPECPRCFSDKEDLTVMEREVLVERIRELGVDPLHLCKLMGVDSTRENVVGLADACLYVAEMKVDAASVEPAQKKRKGEKADAKPTKLSELDAIKKLLQEQMSQAKEMTFDRALQDVKDYAVKPDMDVDVFHGKLISLDSVARANDHAQKELYSFVLQRFAHNKSKRNVGLLVAQLLSTKVEATVLEKEVKFFKNQQSGPVLHTTTAARFESPAQAVYQYPPYPYAAAPPAAPWRQPGPMGGPPRRRRPYPPQRCFKCGDEGHLMRDCPR